MCLYLTSTLFYHMLTPVFLAAGLATDARSTGARAPVSEALVLGALVLGATVLEPFSTGARNSSENWCQKHQC